VKFPTCSGENNFRAPAPPRPGILPFPLLVCIPFCMALTAARIFLTAIAFRAMGNQFAKLRALPHHKLFVLSVSPV